MSEEEIAALKAEAEAARALATKEAGDKANLVEELKAEREKKRLALEELERAKATREDPSSTDPEELVNRVLQKKETESAKEAYELALAEFKRSNNEFSPETDTAGIAYSRFENELKKFNLTGLKTREEFIARLKEVKSFMSRQEKDKTNFYEGTPRVGSDPAGDDNGTLSGEEAKLVKELGWDKERFLKQKEKRPAYIKQLLNSRR